MAETVNYLSYFHPLSLKIFSFLRLRKSADKGLKNHYIIPRKTPITNDKNTHMKQVYNQQIIN